jgi:geranylgeranyl diphosphate synthase type I
MTATILSTLDRSREQVTPALRAAVARLDPATRLVASYHLGWCDEQGLAQPSTGGKSVRPALALLGAAAVGAQAAVALPGAVGVELVHNFSLLHDDVIDGDLQRRHRPAVWAVWGSDTAILAGDAILALAHEVLLESASSGAARATWLLATVTRELTRGQLQDLAFERRSDVTLDQCLDMAAAKTGSLLAASVGIGAVLAGAPGSVVDALRTFGMELGVAFQLVDDVLGIWGDPEITGKPVYSDLRARKKSLPVTYGLSAGVGLPTAWLAGADEPDPALLVRVADALLAAGARSWALGEARGRLRRAARALAEVDIDGRARSELLALAEFVVERNT